MSHVRTKYGLEYDSGGDGGNTSSAKWVVVAAFAVAAVSFVAGIVRRSPPHGDAAPPGGIAAADGGAEQPPPVPSAPPPVPGAAVAAPPAAAAPVDLSGINGKPAKLRSLLMRLGEAARGRDVEMQVSTIESIMSLPGDAARESAEELAGRLGELNWSLMFDRRNPQWIATVSVKSGDTATRIAHEHGSTLASLLKLNGMDRADTLFPGRELKVLNHPRFKVSFSKKARTATLSLNGKFFRRYNLPGQALENAQAGEHAISGNVRDSLKKLGVKASGKCLADLELLVPKGSPVSIEER